MQRRFIYTGEVSIPQHELQDFLRTAELLEIKGLLKSPTATAAAAAASGHQVWLPDGYSQIFRWYVFGPSGFWTLAPLRYAAKFAIWQPCHQHPQAMDHHQHGHHHQAEHGIHLNAISPPPPPAAVHQVQV